MNSVFDGSQSTPSTPTEPIITHEQYEAVQEILKSKPKKGAADEPVSTASGIPSHRTAPFGYDRVVDEASGESALVVNEEEAQEVRKIFKDYLHESE